MHININQINKKKRIPRPVLGLPPLVVRPGAAERPVRGQAASAMQRSAGQPSCWPSPRCLPQLPPCHCLKYARETTWIRPSTTCGLKSKQALCGGLVYAAIIRTWSCHPFMWFTIIVVSSLQFGDSLHIRSIPLGKTYCDTRWQIRNVNWYRGCLKRKQIIRVCIKLIYTECLQYNTYICMYIYIQGNINEHLWTFCGLITYLNY